MKFQGLWKVQEDPSMQNVLQLQPKVHRKKWLVPALMAIIVPVVTGIIFGVPGVVGLLMGGMTTGFTLASMLNNSGGAWDNAKKYIERGNYGGKKSECHKASIVGDTVGDPFKDTCGPSMNILIKLMSMVSVVMAGVTVAWSIFG